jgi:hypothetical protein
MRNTFIASLFCVVVAGFYCGAILAQDVPSKVEFKINDKPTTKKIRIILYVDGVATEPSVSDDGTFLLPALNSEWVNVRLISGKYNLLYEHIYLKKLRGALTFRVFTNRAALDRLSDSDSKCLPGHNLISAYDLNFHDGTEVIVTTCK